MMTGHTAEVRGKGRRGGGREGDGGRELYIRYVFFSSGQ